MILTYLLLLALAQPHLAKPVYSYADGNGNLYTLKHKRLVYDPVTALESSSGMYDGGKAFDLKLSTAQANTLIALFDEALLAADEHQAQRTKGTAILERKLGTQTTSAILTMSSKHKQLIETAFSGLKTKS